MVEDEMRIAREWGRFRQTGQIERRYRMRDRVVDTWRALREDAKLQASGNLPVAIWLYVSLVISVVLIFIVLFGLVINALPGTCCSNVASQIRRHLDCLSLLMVAFLLSFAASYFVSNALQLSRKAREDALSGNVKKMKRFLEIQGIETDEQLIALIELCDMAHQELLRLSDRRANIVSVGLSGSVGVFLSGIFIDPFLSAIWESSSVPINDVSLVLALLVSAMLIGLLVYLPVMYIEDILPTREKTMRLFIYSVRKARCNGLDLE